MVVFGINVNKMFIEKKKNLEKGMQVNTNIKILNVMDAKIKTSESDGKTGLLVSFEVKTSYNPEIGEILLNGNLVYSKEDEKQISKILETWKKEQKVPEEDSLEIYNAILAKTNVEAVILADRMGLPVPFKMPKFKKAE